MQGLLPPDTRHRHEPSQRQVIADKTADLLVQSRHLGNDNFPHFDQFVDDGLNESDYSSRLGCHFGFNDNTIPEAARTYSGSEVSMLFPS